MNAHTSSLARRRLLLAGAACALPLGLARAQAWPTKSIRLVVPNAAASSVDNFARQLMPPLAQALGQTIVIDNIPGSGGVLGMNQLLRSPKDGYTLGMVASNFAIMPNVHRLSYDSRRDVQPVCVLSNGPMLLLVNTKVPAKTVGELVALAKSRAADKTLNFGNPGIGTTAHLAAETFGRSTGTRFLHLPYKGNNQFAQDLLSGELDVGFLSPGVAAPYIQSGKLRALGLSTSMRFPSMPDVPPIAEAGVPGFDIGGWQAVIAPRGVPPAVVERLNAELVKLLKTKEVETYLGTAGSRAVASTPAEAEKWFDRELDNYARIAQAVGLKPET